MNTFGGGSSLPGDPSDPDGPRAIHIDDLPRLEQSEGAIWRPIRRTLELSGVAANAYTGAEAGDEIIEPHDERSPNAAGHEELYLVLSGRATFLIDDAETDAPAGTLIAVDVGSMREATAAEPETTILVLGSAPGSSHPPPPYEYMYASEPSYLEEDFEGAIVILSEGLEHHPRSPGINYQLACLNALVGRDDEAIDHLRIALDGDERIASWAAGDEDLDTIRGRADFPKLD